MFQGYADLFLHVAHSNDYYTEVSNFYTTSITKPLKHTPMFWQSQCCTLRAELNLQI